MSKALTPEEKLDIALTFLSQENQGSYLYPSNIQFEEHLKKKGIDTKEHLPIILHLKWGEYIDTFYKEKKDKEEGQYPHQIKITFKGIKFQHKGGYTSLLKKEKLRGRVQFWQQVLAIPTFIIALVTVCTLILRNPQTTIKIEYPKSVDTATHSKSNKIENVSITINTKDSIIHMSSTSMPLTVKKNDTIKSSVKTQTNSKK